MIDDTTRDACSLYALGLLEGVELERFRARLAAGDPAIVAELRGLEGVVPWIGLAVPEARPSSDLKRRLFSRIGADDFFFLMADEEPWEELPVSGIARRTLFIDPADDARTALLRLAPGARVPLTGVAGESVFVVSGAVTLAGTPLAAGDWHRPAPGTVADSTAGAVLLTAVPAVRADSTLASPATLRAAEGTWIVMDDRVRIKPLGRDPVRGRDLALVSVAAGGIFPEHHHDGTEELFVLRGHCNCQGRRLGPGDYHRAPAGSDHDITPTDSGCDVIVMTQTAA